MREDVVECLVFTPDESGPPETLTSVFREHGIRLTRSDGPKECIDLLGAHDWGFLVIDAGADPLDALPVLARARRTCPDIPVLVLVGQGDIETTVRAMKAGAADCIETPIQRVPLLAAVVPLHRQALCGPHSLIGGLTRVERIVLSHVLDGRTNQEIGRLLSRSPRTIEVHRRHIMAKLGVTNLIELVKHTMPMEETGGSAGPYHQPEAWQTAGAGPMH